MEIKPGIIFNEEEDDSISITGKRMSFSFNKDINFEDNTIPSSKTNKSTKKRKRNTETEGDIIKLENEDSNLPQYMTNTPYHDSYNETNALLKSVIYQSDSMSNDINKDLSDIRASKTLKKKYDYISLLSSTSSALLGTKVTAIRELNKSITDSHNLELKRTKELKLSQNQEDDDKRISDLYNAFVSTPIGIGNNFIPSSSDLIMSTNGLDIINDREYGYDNYLRNMSPEQNMMRYENNPNVKTVVKYFSDTGARCFDVIDLTTGASIENASVPSSMLLENITIDIRNGIARDTNLDRTYPLVVIGNKNIQEY